MSAQSTRIVGSEADRPFRLHGNPNAAERRFARPRSAEFAVDPAEHTFGRAMLAQRIHATTIEGFQLVMHLVLREAWIRKIDEQVDESHPR